MRARRRAHGDQRRHGARRERGPRGVGLHRLLPARARARRAIILRFGALDRVETRARPALAPAAAAREPRDRARWTPSSARTSAAPSAARSSSPSTSSRRRRCRRSDNNIVHLGFVVQYRIGDPVGARFRVAERREILRDAAQAAVREVVGPHLDRRRARGGPRRGGGRDARAAPRHARPLRDRDRGDERAAPGGAAAAARARRVRRRDRGRAGPRPPDPGGARLRERGACRAPAREAARDRGGRPTATARRRSPRRAARRRASRRCSSSTSARPR